MWTFELDCFIKAIGIFLVYNIVACKLFGVPSSLSVTYYLYESKKPALKWLFTAMMWAVAFCLMPAWIEISSDSNFQFLSFLAAVSIMFVGTAPAFRSCKLESIVHQVSAWTAAIFSILWIILVTQFWWIILVWLVICVILAISTKTLKSAKTYWIEMVAFGSTFTAILLHYLM